MTAAAARGRTARRPGLAARAGAALALAVAAVAPSGLLRGVLAAGGRLFFLAPAVRRALIANAGRILGRESTPAARRRFAFAVLESYGRAIAELLLARRTFAARGRVPIEVRGGERFERALAARRGLIAVSLHMGCYELGAMVLAQRCGSAAIVYRRDPAAWFESVRSRRRRELGVDEIPIDASPFFGVEVLRRLREGGALLVAGELAARERGEPFEFLGATARFSTWPARMALASGAPIVPAFLVRGGSGGREPVLRIEEPIAPEPGASPREITARLVRLFESVVREHGREWLMPWSFWTDAAPQETAAPSGGAST